MRTWTKMYVLDTDISIDYLRGMNEVKDRVAKLDNLFITTVSLAELFFGIYNSKNFWKHYSKLLDFLAGVQVLNVEFSSCNLFGKIKSSLKNKGKIVGDFDIIIAAITISKNFKLITKNVKHYKNIEGLSVMSL